MVSIETNLYTNILYLLLVQNIESKVLFWIARALHTGSFPLRGRILGKDPVCKALAIQNKTLDSIFCTKSKYRI